jgi:hypothetical protein
VLETEPRRVHHGESGNCIQRIHVGMAERKLVPLQYLGPPARGSPVLSGITVSFAWQFASCFNRGIDALRARP